jgi:phage terminase large subunit GpA-like protein
MIAAGEWVAENPEGRIRGYHINCLYYQLGLGPRWLDLVRMWIDAQNDPARLKTFINDRLAEPWEDPAMRAVKHNLIADRAEPWPLRKAPAWVLAVTVGIDTQDNRLAVHIIGWGRGMASWTLDYIELPGDPGRR